MIDISLACARLQLSSLLRRAADNHEVFVIRREDGGDVALIAADDLKTLIEMRHLLQTEKNSERLLTALARARTR